MNESVISRIIFEGLTRKGLSKRQLAEKCGFSAQTITNFENRGSASRETLEKIARILEIPVDTLLLASKKFVEPWELNQSQLEILSLYDSLPQPFQDAAKKHLDILFSLATEVGGAPQRRKILELGKRLPSGMVSIPIIGTANENEKPNDGEDDETEGSD